MQRYINVYILITLLTFFAALQLPLMKSNSCIINYFYTVIEKESFGQAYHKCNN